MKDSKASEFIITEIQLKDLTLRDSIASFISQEIEKDSIFKNIGYVKLTLNTVSSKYKNDALFTYLYNRSYDEFTGDIPYPQFYTMIANKLVVITDHSITTNFNLRYNKNNIKQFKKIVETYLPKRTKIRFKGKTVPYRESIVVIDGGKRFYRLRDGSVVVENNTYF
ncbi:hypothetical protein [Sphingobacterium sp. CZ-UAM]|uniref:hypothetical protein n=1 Tax=Sphingobacterium sp. CZ-UAM TaxID=1933868 RepID=UPI0011158D50|nr:hypothetical protein [Sphingobacterium sp. CZ-UAM]